MITRMLLRCLAIVACIQIAILVIIAAVIVGMGYIPFAIKWHLKRRHYLNK